MLSEQYIRLFDRKLNNSLLVILLYVFCCNMILPWVTQPSINPSALLPMQQILGLVQPPDHGVSVMALGLGPWLRARILVQLAFLFLGIKGEAARKSELISDLFTLVFACTAALRLTQSMSGPEEVPAVLWKTSAFFGLITGVFLVVWLAQSNQRYGIGGSSLLVMTNIIRNQGLQFFREKEYLLSRYPVLGMGRRAVGGLILFAILVLLTMVLIEMTQIRLPVHHVMLYSSQAEENYLALKLNPAGALPVMFAGIVYEFLYTLVNLVSYAFPRADALARLAEHSSLKYTEGVALFLLGFFLLSILFSLVTVNPKETAETWQRTGDYLVGVRPGRDTRRYLRRKLLAGGGFSAAVMCLVLAVPMLMNVRLGAGAMMQSPIISLVILVGIVLQMIEEAKMLLRFKDYRTLMGSGGYVG